MQILRHGTPPVAGQIVKSSESEKDKERTSYREMGDERRAWISDRNGRGLWWNAGARTRMKPVD